MPAKVTRIEITQLLPLDPDIDPTRASQLQILLQYLTELRAKDLQWVKLR